MLRDHRARNARHSLLHNTHFHFTKGISKKLSRVWWNIRKSFSLAGVDKPLNNQHTRTLFPSFLSPFKSSLFSSDLLLLCRGAKWSFLSILSRAWLSPLKYTNTHIFIDQTQHAKINKMGGLKTIATVATVAFVTTGSSLSAANGKEQQKLDGAAFLETFDDGLKGWVKSEVEQYTGAHVFLSLPLSRRTNESSCARLCWFQSARRLAVKEIRARDERERFTTSTRQFRSSREKRSHHHRLVGPPKTRFVRELFSTFQSPKEARR